MEFPRLARFMTQEIRPPREKKSKQKPKPELGEVTDALPYRRPKRKKGGAATCKIETHEITTRQIDDHQRLVIVKRILEIFNTGNMDWINAVVSEYIQDDCIAYLPSLGIQIVGGHSVHRLFCALFAAFPNGVFLTSDTTVNDEGKVRTLFSFTGTQIYHLIFDKEALVESGLTVQDPALFASAAGSATIATEHQASTRNVHSIAISTAANLAKPAKSCPSSSVEGLKNTSVTSSVREAVGGASSRRSHSVNSAEPGAGGLTVLGLAAGIGGPASRSIHDIPGPDLIADVKPRLRELGEILEGETGLESDGEYEGLQTEQKTASSKSATGKAIKTKHEPGTSTATSSAKTRKSQGYEDEEDDEEEPAPATVLSDLELCDRIYVDKLRPLLNSRNLFLAVPNERSAKGSIVMVLSEACEIVSFEVNWVCDLES